MTRRLARPGNEIRRIGIQSVQQAQYREICHGTQSSSVSAFRRGKLDARLDNDEER